MSSQIPQIAKIQLPECAAPLAEPHRYYVMYGGRNGVKSWSVARHLLIRGAQEPIRALCCRETMIKISESVHTLLSDQIQAMQLGAYYDIQTTAIYGKNGTRFVYASLRGLKNDKTALKAYESFDVAWVEEAQSTSKSSWSTLIPTIRKAGSRIYVTFNPELESDDTYQRFVVHTPPDCALIRTSYRDNPWLSDVAKKDMAHLKATDPDEYEHIYEGLCVQNVQGAIYANELRQLDKDQRVCQVTYDPLKPVQTFWDIGDRFTSIWFAQQMPFQVRVLAYQDGEGLGLKEHVKLLQERPYVYGTMWLPHDAKSPQLGTGKSIEEQLRGYGFKVQIVPRLSITARINALRTVFPTLWFDSENCADGLQGLRHYRWPPQGSQGQLKREPLHDWASHPGDAATYMAVAIKGDVVEDPGPQDPVEAYNEQIPEYGWMQ